MEEEKRNKRNRKKKNRQTKGQEDGVAIVEAASVDDSHTGNGRNGFSDAASDHNNFVEGSDANSNGHDCNGANDIFSEAEKERLIQKEASLEKKIEQLQKENNFQKLKEDTLEKIKQLKEEKYIFSQKQADLEIEIGKLLGERHLRLQREVELEEKIRQLSDEKNSLDLLGASLNETIKHLDSDKDTWIQEKSSMRETILSLNDDISRLQAKVAELEESRHNLLQENEQLTESASDLRSQIHNLEQNTTSAQSSDEVTKEDLKSEVEAACVLVEKLITENADLVEKVNQLYIELQRSNPKTVQTSAVESDQMPRTDEDFTVSDPVSTSSQSAFESRQKSQVFESFPKEEGGIANSDMIGEVSSVAPSALATGESEEIVIISLDDSKAQNGELQSVEADEEPVPLSDAPLIGAPFRLISRVAKYVSGADLVDKSSH